MTTTEKTWEERAKEIGSNAMASIREMVAALECDYERIEELKEERDGYDGFETDGPETWEECYPDDAEELKELEEEAGECESREDAEQRIMEDPLSLQFRSGWCNSKEEMEPEEFELLLATGGPAVRIIGEIRDGQAHRPILQVQDWFTPWTEYFEEGASDVLEAYCNCFCFDN